MQEVKPFDWHRILISEETNFDFLWEVLFRTAVMFIFLLIVLKFTSKRGIQQLSVFELALLIALGSATGDPMFYHNVGLLNGALVLVVVVGIYILITYLSSKSDYFEEVMEGKPVCILKDGRIIYKNYKTIHLAYDKFFAALRGKSIDHLGQVSMVYFETSGEMSVYLCEKEKVIYGLPIFPEIIDNPVEKVTDARKYACIYCGNVEELAVGEPTKCEVCTNSQWVKASDKQRIE